MNTQEEIRDLLVVTEAKYQLEQQEFQKIITQENHLRGELARLDALHAQTREKTTEIGEMRAIGADVIWQGWVARSKIELNLQLAKVMARKLHHLAQVKRVYGNVLVAQELLDQTRTEARIRKTKDALAHAIEVSLQI